MQQTIYLVVADSGQANIYRTDANLASLEQVQQQIHPSSRLTRSELDSDRPGSQTSGAGGHHNLGGDKNSHQHEGVEFAHSLCKYLHSEHQAGKFTQLMLAAPPHFLGELRKQLHTDCLKILGKTVNKNLLRAGEQSIVEHFNS